jgi:nucleoside-diphosphate-sugar epimerase
MQPHLGSLNEPDSLLAVLPEVDAVVYSAYGYNNADNAAHEISQGKSHISWILKAMSNSGKIFVLTSGTGVFPDTSDTIFTEEVPFPTTNSPITIARRNLEMETRTAAQDGVHSIVLRPPTVYGRGGSFLIPRFLLDHARSAGESVYIEGMENNKWSAVHVDDLADLYVLALEKAQPGSLFNTASQSGLTTHEIAASISCAAKLGGKTKAISLKDAQRLFGPWAELWGINNQSSGEKARMDLGWNPQATPMLEDIEHGSYVAAGVATV